MKDVLIKRDRYVLTNLKKPTRRGVIWLGQTCNLNCYFCYFAKKIANKNHPEHPFFSIEKAKEICKVFRDDYDFNSIDIQGGEPTIYPKIFELIDYCNNIGLKPSLITNAIALNNYKFASKFKIHEVYDFLISLQGIGGNYDKVVGMKGGFEKQMKALKNLNDLNIPFRINAVLSKEIINDIDEIASIAIEYGARVVNFIGYNDTGDQKETRKKDQIPFYSNISDKLSPIIDFLESKEIEVNVRFIPFCIFKKKYRKNIQNFKQMIYDLHEWEKSSRLWIDRPSQRRAAEKTEHRPSEMVSLLKRKISKGDLSFFSNLIKNNRKYVNPYKYQEKIHKNLKYFNPSISFIEGYTKVEHFYFEMALSYTDKVKVDKCKLCSINFICDGFHQDLIKEFGDSEVRPVCLDKNIYDPRYYLNEQLKVVENQELGWFLEE